MISTNMEESSGPNNYFIKSFTFPSNINRILVAVLALAIVLGIGTGYTLSNKSGGNTVSPLGNIGSSAPKTAQQDNRTFRDFAEGTLRVKDPDNGDTYAEGTHELIRDGAQPVALTSSVVDLSKYEGKKVKVYGETQKALKEGWLMDVGKVEVE